MPTIKHILTTLLIVVGLAGAPQLWANLGADDGDEGPDLSAARQAIEAADWARAIDLLKKASDAHPDSADVHNFLGYAHRQSGQLETALRHYQKALELNPRHKHAHEYIGEAYLMAGDIARAEEHLAQLQKICSPIPCEELKELRRAIDAFKKARN